MALAVKNLAANAGDIRDTRLVPELGRSPGGGGHGDPLQYSCLKNPKGREVWRSAVHGAAKGRIPLGSEAPLYVHTHTHNRLSLVHFLSEPLAQLWMQLWESVYCGVPIPSEVHTESNFIHSDHCSVP